MVNILANFSDAKLLELIRQGDDIKAFDELYSRHVVSLLNVAYQRLQSEEDAKDVVQEVFYNFLTKVHNLGHTENIVGYLHVCLKHKILDIYRKKLIRSSERHTQTCLELTLSSEMNAADDGVRVKEMKEIINQTIEELPDKCKEAFRMSRYEDLSYKEIAVKMEVSIKTVEKHISKALRILHTKLDD